MTRRNGFIFNLNLKVKISPIFCIQKKKKIRFHRLIARTKRGRDSRRKLLHQWYSWIFQQSFFSTFVQPVLLLLLFTSVELYKIHTHLFEFVEDWEGRLELSVSAALKALKVEKRRGNWTISRREACRSRWSVRFSLPQSCVFYASPRNHLVTEKKR